MRTNDMWLVYVDECTGQRHYQPWRDLQDVGTLIGEDGEDMVVLGWTDDPGEVVW